MPDADDLQAATRNMDTPAFLRFLITERFAHRTLVTSSLRARSIVLLKLIADIDPATPVVFCHAQAPFPESLDYRAALVRRLGLRDVRDPAENEGGPPEGDRDHSEGLWAENPTDGTRAYRTIRLNRSLAGCACWISGVYHGPYATMPPPRVISEGRLVRINPLASWTQGEVRGFMREHDLPYHPRSPLRSGAPAGDAATTAQTYHY